MSLFKNPYDPNARLACTCGAHILMFVPRELDSMSTGRSSRPSNR